MIVVDSNILAYRFIPGPRNADARSLVVHDPIWAAPLLWRSEFRNVLAGHLRRQTFGRMEAGKIMLHAAASLTGGQHAVDDDLIFDLVVRSRCTAYDCEFAALAEQLNVQLVTEDRDLLSAFPTRCRSIAQALAI